MLGYSLDELSSKPPVRFNMFHLDSKEKHLLSIKCLCFDQSINSFRTGLLHLNSRSLVYDCDNLQYPLKRFRFGEFNLLPYPRMKLQHQIQNLFISGSWDISTPRRQAEIQSKVKKTSYKTSKQSTGSSKSQDMQRWTSLPSFRKNNVQSIYNPYSVDKASKPVKPTQFGKMQKRKNSLREQQHLEGAKHYNELRGVSKDSQFESPDSIQDYFQPQPFLEQPGYSVEYGPGASFDQMNFISHADRKHIDILLKCIKEWEYSPAFNSFKDKDEIWLLHSDISQQVSRVKPGGFTSEKNSDICLVPICDDISRRIFVLETLNSLQRARSEDDIEKIIDRIFTRFYDNENIEYLKDPSIIHLEGAHRIKFQTVQEGVLFLSKQFLIFYPLINAPSQEMQIKIKYEHIRHIQIYYYLHRQTALRIFTYQGIPEQNFLRPPELILHFWNQDITLQRFAFIESRCANIQHQLRDLELHSNLWIRGYLDNYEYLAYLNFRGNRSFQDPSQYPVYPWVLRGYENELDLRNPKLYRNLQKHMGQLDQIKFQLLEKRYERSSKHFAKLKNANEDDRPALFMSHYSTPGSVYFYLIRQVPSYLMRLQSGHTLSSPSERIFLDIKTCWKNCFQTLDFKELIPEFYTGDGNFLLNHLNADLGIGRKDDEVVKDVKLPKWSQTDQEKDSAYKFVKIMRAALQSVQVSAHLHEWIDLMFGNKETSEGRPYFSGHCYSEGIDWKTRKEQCGNALQRDSLDQCIFDFGQCPRKVFERGHPRRVIQKIQ